MHMVQTFQTDSLRCWTNDHNCIFHSLIHSFIDRVYFILDKEKGLEFSTGYLTLKW